MIISIFNTLKIFKKQNLYLIFLYSFILIFTEVISLGLLFPLLLIVFNKENIYLQKFEYILTSYDLIFFNFFVTFILILFGIYLLRFLINNFLGFKIANYKSSIQKFYSKLALKFFLYGPYINFKNNNSNEFAVIISKETEKFSNTVDALIKIFTDGLIVFIIVLILLYQNFYVSSFLILILSFIFLIIKFLFHPYIKKWGERHMLHDINRMTSLNEIFNMIKEIKIFDKSVDFIKKYSFDNSRTQVAQRNRIFFSLFIRNLIELILVTSIIFVIIIVNFNGIKLENFFPIISFFFLAILRILPSVIKILNSIQLILFSKNSIVFHSKLTKFYKKKYFKKHDTVLDQKNISKKKNVLVLKNISFNYKANQILKNLSVKFYENNIIGIKGQSGSGKTTLIEIILGLITPKKGDVIFNNKNIDKLKENWKSKISYVSQDNNLFSGSAYQNIAFETHDDLVDKKKINELLKKLNLKFYNNFKNKLNKKIHYNSINLSGGERQRLTIARGLFRSKDIIILDEITSSLDHANEIEILKEIKKFKRSKIIIIISHKNSSLKVCDVVYELKDKSLKKV